MLDVCRGRDGDAPSCTNSILTGLFNIAHFSNYPPPNSSKAGGSYGTVTSRDRWRDGEPSVMSLISTPSSKRCIEAAKKSNIATN
jgi:hypothetical protein